MSIKTEGISAVNKTVTVSTNDPKQPQVVLTLTAVVEPEFQLSERSIYFGNVPRGKEVVKELSIAVPPEKTGKILSAESTDPHVTVKVEPVAGTNGKKYKLTAVQKPNAKDGYHFGMLVLKTSSSLTPEVKIPVRGMVTPPPTQDK